MFHRDSSIDVEIARFARLKSPELGAMFTDSLVHATLMII